MQTLSSLFPQSSTLVIAFSRLWIPDPSRRPSISSRFSSSVERGLPSRSVHVAAPIVQMGPSLPSHHDSHPFLSSRPIHHRPVSLAFSLNIALLLSHVSFGTAPAASIPLVLFFSFPLTCTLGYRTPCSTDCTIYASFCVIS